MRIEQLAAFLVRVFGIMLAASVVINLTALIAVYQVMPDLGISFANISGAALALILTPLVILITVAFSMTAFPVQFSGLVLSSRQRPITMPKALQPVEDLDYLLVGFLALYGVTNALLYGLEVLPQIILYQSASMLGEKPPWLEDHLAQLAAFFIRLVLSLWAVLNSAKLVALLRKARGKPVSETRQERGHK